MKFGKYVGYNQNPEWSPFMVNYRSMEKSILRVKKHRDAIATKKGGKEEDALLNQTDLFRILLDAELNKVNKFFVEEETKIVIAFEEVCEDIARKKRDWGITENNYAGLLSADNFSFLQRGRDKFVQKDALLLKELYCQIDSLQNFASLNYSAVKSLLGSSS
jgi:hypothetical protein